MDFFIYKIVKISYQKFDFSLIFRIFFFFFLKTEFLFQAATTSTTARSFLVLCGQIFLHSATIGNTPTTRSTRRNKITTETFNRFYNAFLNTFQFYSIHLFISSQANKYIFGTFKGAPLTFIIYSITSLAYIQGFKKGLKILILKNAGSKLSIHNFLACRYLNA
jgi:hypothetical protein